MALSAASPFYRGYVSDIDCRWGVISASVDDRTREERGLEVSDMGRRHLLFFREKCKTFINTKFCLWSSESLMGEFDSCCGKYRRDCVSSHVGCTAYRSKYLFS